MRHVARNLLPGDIPRRCAPSPYPSPPKRFAFAIFSHGELLRANRFGGEGTDDALFLTAHADPLPFAGEGAEDSLRELLY